LAKTAAHRSSIAGVTLNGNQIVALSDDTSRATTGERIDLGGMTLMPGPVTFPQRSCAADLRFRL